MGKKLKLYIPIAVRKNVIGEKWLNNWTLINANKIPELKPFLPTEEALQIHMQIQKLELEKDKNYKPKPLYISIERSIFNNIISKIKGKNKFAPEDHIALTVQTPSIPICIINSK